VSESLRVTIVYEDGEEGWMSPRFRRCPVLIARAERAKKSGRT